MQGRTVIVTGAGKGLGRAYADAFAREGAHVVVNDIATDESGEPLAERVAEQLRGTGAAAVSAPYSVADPEGAEAVVDTAVAHFGRVDALVNNAGIVYGGSLVEQAHEDFRRMVDVHLMGTFLTSRAAFRRMAEQGGGSILNTVSTIGLFGMAGMASYAAAKGGILGLSHVLAIEGAEHGIRVNALAPMADTNPGRTKGAEEFFAPMGRRAAAEYVAPFAVFLAGSDAAGTGGVYSAAGGRYARVATVLGDGWISPGPNPPTVEEIAAGFDTIRDLRPGHELERMQEEVRLINQRLAELGNTRALVGE
ncbi:SDR family NAD(P)-dependent oxidoreductase [Streptomyces brasiliensis]|uniref:Serine/threonine protein kinase n=1 Tax=Streptomyces brasiliensis TaxID=1954 RepID=A0A917NWM4_9ACTN|nr:SDR family NAD(P)-dependent oxidoreductase [Streptomyces brasiliensis]GGJ35278.1 serine/threonine protein kinase [Streptomyces brasiliensis]